MQDTPRFSMEAADVPIDASKKIPTEYERALNDFHRAVPNVLMLGPSLRPNSSFTKNAVKALVDLVIANRRMRGIESPIDAREVLRKNDVPEEIWQLLLERMEAEMQRKLAQGHSQEEISAVRSESFGRIVHSFGSQN